MLIDLPSLNLNSISNSGTFFADSIDLVGLIGWNPIDGSGIGGCFVDTSGRVLAGIVGGLILLPLV